MISIRQARRGDSELIIRKVAELVSELAGKSFSLDMSTLLTVIQEAIQSNRYIVLLACDDVSQVVGLITLGEAIAAYAGGRFAVVHELYVENTFRSSGIGKQLLDRAKQICMEYGWGRLEVNAPNYPEWSRTKDFYLREDFEEMGPHLRWVGKFETNDMT